jgi:hypothetical protein
MDGRLMGGGRPQVFWCARQGAKQGARGRPTGLEPAKKAAIISELIRCIPRYKRYNGSEVRNEQMTPDAMK